MVLLLLEINHDIRRMIREILELVYDLWNNKARKARVTNCKLIYEFSLAVLP